MKKFTVISVLVIMLFLALFVKADLNTGLGSVYKFDTALQYNDSITPSRYFTATSADIKTSPVSGQALYCKIGTHYDLTTGLGMNLTVGTINYWIKPNGMATADQYPYYTAQSGGYNTFMGEFYTDNKFYSTIYDNTHTARSLNALETTLGMADNNSIMVTIIYDGVRQQLFINGTNKINSSDGTNKTLDLATGQKFCVCNDCTTNYYTGYIDELYIWNGTVLSNAQITTLWNSGTGTFYPFTASQSIDFISQSPSDITSTNSFAKTVNLTYNLTNYNLSAANNPLLKLHFKTNNSLSDCLSIVNGSAVCNYTAEPGYGNFFNITNVSSTGQTLMWQVDDNDVLPANYNIDEDTMQNYQKTNTTLSGNSKWLRIGFLNISSSYQYNFLELGVLPQSPTLSSALQIYYCNSSFNYDSDPATNQYCGVFAVILASTPLNHSHNTSNHYVVPMPINTSSSTLAGIKVTQVSSILLFTSSASNGWNVASITPQARTGIYRSTSNNFVTYTNLSGTPDAHIHMFAGSENFYYFACANDTSSTTGYQCSTLKNDSLQLGNLPPSAVNIFSPKQQVYAGNLLINYSQSVSPHNYSVQYNISLLNYDETFVQSIQANNSFNLTYTWNTTLLTGYYDIDVVACDNYNQCEHSISKTFLLDNKPPRFNQSIRNITINHNSTLLLLLNATDNETNVTYYTNNTVFPATLTNGTINKQLNISLTGFYSVLASINDSVNNTNTTIFTINVTNNAPFMASLSLTPSQPTNTSNLTCTAITPTDVDGDNLTYMYVFQNDSTNLTSFSTLNTMNCSADTKSCNDGMNMTCYAYLNDSDKASVVYTSNKVQILSIPQALWDLLTPANNSVQNDNVIVFNYSIQNSPGSTNCSLIKQNSSGTYTVQSSTNVLNNAYSTLNYTTFTDELSVNTWNISCSEENYGSFGTTTKKVDVDKVNPVITLGNPLPLNASSFIQYHNVLLNVTCSDDHLYEFEINISLAGTQKFYFYAYNLTPPTYNFLNTTNFSAVGQYQTVIKCGDDHNPTMNLVTDDVTIIDPYPELFDAGMNKGIGLDEKIVVPQKVFPKLVVKDDKLKSEVNISLSSYNKELQMMTQKKVDNKIKFDVYYQETGVEDDTYFSEFTITSTDRVDLRDPKKAHFVIPWKHYVSFEDEYNAGTKITLQKVSGKEYKVYLESKSPVIDPYVGNLNNASATTYFNVTASVPPTITSFSPLAAPTVNEGASSTYSITATTTEPPLTYVMQVDGVTYGTTDSTTITWSGSDSGYRNVTYYACNGYGVCSNVYWNTTVLNTIFEPDTPTLLTPSNGLFEYYIPVKCSQNTFVRNAEVTYELSVSVDNASYTNFSVDNPYGYADYDISKYAFGTTFDFRCRTHEDGLYSVNFTYASGNKKSDVQTLALFTTQNTPLFFAKRPYPVGVLADFTRTTNTKIVSVFLDCNGDELYDYFHDYSGVNVTKQLTIDDCVNNKGVVKHVAGVILQKLDVNSTWDVQECRSLPVGSTNCLLKKSFEVSII